MSGYLMQISICPLARSLSTACSFFGGSTKGRGQNRPSESLACFIDAAYIWGSRRIEI
jgi:hypothetical protein